MSSVEKERFERKKKELQEEINNLREKKRNLIDEYQDDKFKEDKKCIKRYYINSYRKEYNGVYYLILDTFEKGFASGAYVDAYKLRLNNGDDFFGINVTKTMVNLTTLRYTKPIKKKTIKEKLTKPKNEMLKRVKDKFNIDL